MKFYRTKKTTFRKNLDNWFSRFIRLRDSNEFGILKCCTCSKLVYFMDADNGHFINRKHLGTAWHEDNCHGQCSYCNRFQEGLKDKYLIFLKNKIGQSGIDLLYAVKNEPFDKSFIKIRTKTYRDLSYNLLKEKTLKEQPYWAIRK